MEQKKIPSREYRGKGAVQINNGLLKGSVTRNIIGLALPIMATNLIENAYNIIDMIFVGRLGPAALAGVSMGGVLMLFTWTLLVGLIIGTSSFIARYYGAGDGRMVNRVTMQALVLSVIVSVVLTAFGFWGVEPALRLLGAEGEVLVLGTMYATIIFCFSFNHIFLYVINSIFRGSGDTRTPMITLGISSIINIILDPLLIFGLGPFPEMGVKGAAIATVIGQAVGTGLNFYILYHGISRVKLKHTRFVVDSSLLKSIVRVAIPGSMQNLMGTVSGLVLMRLVTGFGTVAVAAYGVGMRLEIMVMLPGWALGAAVATILGQNLGADQLERAEKTAWRGVGIYLTILGLICLGLWFGAEQVIGVFNDEAGVIMVGVSFIRTISPAYLCLSLSLILGMSMNGAGYAIVPMLVNFLALICFRVPFALMATGGENPSLDGLFLAIALSLMLQAVLTVIWFKRGHWKQKQIHNH